MSHKNTGPGLEVSSKLGKKPERELFFSLEEYALRLKETRQLMKLNNLDLLLVVEYEDIYYLTAYQTVGAPMLELLVIPSDPLEEMYFVTRLLELSNTEYRSILRKYYSYNDYDDEIDFVFQKIMDNNPKCKTLGVQSKSKRISYYQLNKLNNMFLSANPDRKIIDSSMLIAQLRLIKSPAEINLIKKAAEFCSAGLSTVQNNVKIGTMETEVAGYIYKSMAELGCEYCAYPTFVASGSNTKLGHYTGDQTIIKNNEILFVENGGCYQRYHAAMMRTFYIGNELPEELKEIESAVMEAMDTICKIMIPNACCGDIDSKIRKICSKRDDWICSLRMAYSIGIGFYTDWGEPELITIEPNSKKILQENMVLHIIPWIQIPSKSWAVGLSDTVVITPTGAKSLFVNPPPREIQLISC
jgi:Xaa-Pro dipeptidase